MAPNENHKCICQYGIESSVDIGKVTLSSEGGGIFPNYSAYNSSSLNIILIYLTTPFTETAPFTWSSVTSLWKIRFFTRLELALNSVKTKNLD